jgi:hypothetical protein
MYPTQRNGPHPTTCFGDPTVIFRNVGVISAAPSIIFQLVLYNATCFFLSDSEIIILPPETFMFFLFVTSLC